MAADNWKEKFLESLRQEPNIAKACRAAGIHRSTAYAARKRSESDDRDDFLEQWDYAMEDGLDEYEHDLLKISRGEMKGGQVAGIIFLLKANRYEKRTDKTMPSKLTLEWGNNG